MPKFKIILRDSRGEEEVDEIFDSEDQAQDHARYLVSCANIGAETLNLSNPGDYPLEGFEELEYEIIEIDEE